MKCPDCNSIIKESVNVCPNCGCPVKSVSFEKKQKKATEIKKITIVDNLFKKFPKLTKHNAAMGMLILGIIYTLFSIISSKDFSSILSFAFLFIIAEGELNHISIKPNVVNITKYVWEVVLALGIISNIYFLFTWLYRGDSIYYIIYLLDVICNFTIISLLISDKKSGNTYFVWCKERSSYWILIGIICDALILIMHLFGGLSIVNILSILINTTITFSVLCYLYLDVKEVK